MNLKSISASVCLTTGALLLFSTSAHAITFTTGGTTVTNQGLYTSELGATTINFNTAPTIGTSPYNSGIATFTQPETGTNPANGGLLVRNSSQTVGATNANPTAGYAPGDGTTEGKDTSNFLITGGYYDRGNTGYSSTGNGTTTNGNTGNLSEYYGPITINFSGQGAKYFGLYWGLINETNEISFYSGADATGTQYTLNRANNNNTATLTSVGNSVTGNELGLSGVVAGASGPSQYINFFTASGETIRSIRLSNTNSSSTSAGNGFEFDNVSYTEVPWSPSSILNLLGLGALGAVIGLKRKLKNDSKLLSQDSPSLN